MVFSAGTTGEWDRVDNETRQRVTQISAEEVAKQNSSLTGTTSRAVEAWAGVTAPTAQETLENLDFAIACGADAAVLAPLSVAGVDDPVRFVARDVSDLLDARRRRIPVYLYDNADIAVDPKVLHIRTRQVKALSRLDFVRGIKVSATRKVLGNYTKAAASFHERGEFGIYVGNAMLIFDVFRPRTGAVGTIVEHWNRFLLHDVLPTGVVSGPANLWPREWQRAWQVACAGDVERMEEMQALFQRYRRAYNFPAGSRRLAALKRGLFKLGVISSDAVAPGTPALSAEEASRFDHDFETLRSEVQARLPEVWVSQEPEVESA